MRGAERERVATRRESAASARAQHDPPAPVVQAGNRGVADDVAALMQLDSDVLGLAPTGPQLEHDTTGVGLVAVAISHHVPGGDHGRLCPDGRVGDAFLLDRRCGGSARDADRLAQSGVALAELSGGDGVELGGESGQPGDLTGRERLVELVEVAVRGDGDQVLGPAIAPIGGTPACWKAPPTPN